MDARQDFYLAALAQCPGLGSRRLGQLLQTGLDAVSLWQMPALEMSRLVKMPQGLVSTIDAFRRDHPDMPEALADICEQRGVHLCTLQDEDYPYLLKEIFSPPPVLYCRGTLMPKERRVAIVGSRRLSPYGEALALEFGEQLAAAGLTVVSGAARGIDTRSHRGALKTGRTVAVLGCGIDVAYPAENRRLLAQIAESGAVISEYAPGVQPLPAFFPARNRIISGLSEGTLVVEAAARSGSLITAELALSEGREVYALPGSVFSKMSEGCHHLIQQGARLVTKPGDILEDMGLVQKVTAKKQKSMTPDERRVYQVLSFDRALSADEILMSLPDGEMPNLSFTLLQMELKGLIIENELHAYRRAERE
ncbi:MULTISPECIES: DNA-processing protein DprA [Mitsuokella]|uniref:DNA-processing protein DprA n=1 Tax=Mitsuokella TaxID=52225 RepID=UPI002431DBB1|nr:MULTISPECIES: DNA-processing protein DprA [Mitsuokella]MCI6607693.1 DNA-processing protein DprA [Mitsuokella jalaludinii]MCI6612149.1 DNA-processing protein DprA [Mitsuokella jalaludinii]MCI7185043.1 DNA-processing protein DprA [Mitsuokella jalaludinii]MDD7746166.1 DNA-processing protein DprA [Mitsuokella jalaludinii]MDY5364982.1 DNA-processing protein DprA [Mitsuokella jalaludinii]